ncbi:MAG TPA: MBOAT family protein [Verrucomicrobiae bacterium]|nr:MBOAT family protein [Verrucomicrobiae bacterium]
MEFFIYQRGGGNRVGPAGSCAGKTRGPFNSVDWIPLLALPFGAILIQNSLSAWVFMWLLASTVYFGCKWLTLRRAAMATGICDTVAYLFAWTGMDADGFLRSRTGEIPKRGEWLAACAKTVAGGVLFWFAASEALVLPPPVTGWLGMTGIVLFLHFGLFHLLSLAWRAAGRQAEPLMRAPLLAKSLADFWGGRWNTAFHQLAATLVFRKLARPLGVARATMAVFLVSGLVHDLVISLPARGGYGRPTAYFLAQGVAILFERSGTGRSLGLGRGWRGRIYALTVAALPAPWLFHAPFINNVMLPMVRAMGN